YAAQLLAHSAWSSLPWLGRLQVPTLVVTGDDDPLVPAANGAILAHAIPGARLLVAQGEGHLLLSHPESATLPAIAAFLAAAEHGGAWGDAVEIDQAAVERALAEAGPSAQPYGFFSSFVRSLYRPSTAWSR